MSILERATKFKNYIFEHNGDFERDLNTIQALKVLKKESIESHFSEIISLEKRKMVNILTFADSHANKKDMKSSFSDLKTWKSAKVYK